MDIKLISFERCCTAQYKFKVDEEGNYDKERFDKELVNMTQDSSVKCVIKIDTKGNIEILKGELEEKYLKRIKNGTIIW